MNSVHKSSSSFKVDIYHTYLTLKPHRNHVKKTLNPKQQYLKCVNLSVKFRLKSQNLIMR